MTSCPTLGFGNKKTVATFGFGEVDKFTGTALEVIDYTLDLMDTDDFVLDLGAVNPSGTANEISNIYTGDSTRSISASNDMTFQPFLADNTGTVTKIRANVSKSITPDQPLSIGIYGANSSTHHPEGGWVGTPAYLQPGDVTTSQATYEVTVNSSIASGVWYGVLFWSDCTGGTYRTWFTAGQNGVPDEAAHYTQNGGISWLANTGDFSLDVVVNIGSLAAYDFTLDVNHLTQDYTLDVGPVTIVSHEGQGENNIYAPVVGNGIHNGQWVGQQFTQASTQLVTKIRIPLYKLSDSYTAGVGVAFYATSGGMPTGGALAVATMMTPADLTFGLPSGDSTTWKEISVTPYTYQSGVMYCWIVYSTNASGTYALGVSASNTGYANGTTIYTSNQGGNYNTTGYDEAFELRTYILDSVTCAVEFTLDMGQTFDFTLDVIP